MNAIRTTSPLIVACALMVAGCSADSFAGDEKIADLAQQVRYVTDPVQSFVQDENPAADISGADLIKNATSANPRLLEPLSKYYLTARREGSYAVVLLCDAEQQRALVEDIGCTDKVDWWQTEKDRSTRACSFHLEAQKICGKD